MEPNSDAQLLKTMLNTGDCYLKLIKDYVVGCCILNVGKDVLIHCVIHLCTC